MIQLTPEQIETALQLLGERLDLAHRGPYRLVVCGGAALIACALISRQTTRDIDVVAMTHDPSEGFRQVLVSMLGQLGYEQIASQL